MTSRIQYDSVDLRAIPLPISPTDIVAYYCDGPRATMTRAEVEIMFPRNRLNPIDVNTTRASIARTVDCESKDVPAEALEQWLTDFKNTNPGYEHGARGVVYSDRSNLPAVRKGTGRWILGKDYYLWVATGDGTLFTGPGIIMCQNRWLLKYDTSVVFDDRFLPA